MEMNDLKISFHKKKQILFGYIKIISYLCIQETENVIIWKQKSM